MNGTSIEGPGYQQQWSGMYSGTMGGVGEEQEEAGKVLGLLEKLEIEGCPLKVIAPIFIIIIIKIIAILILITIIRVIRIIRISKQRIPLFLFCEHSCTGHAQNHYGIKARN